MKRILTARLWAWVLFLVFVMIVLFASFGCTALQHYRGQVMTRSNPYYKSTPRSHFAPRSGCPVHYK